MTNYLFDGGTITDPAAIRLQNTELDGARFWTWETSRDQTASQYRSTHPSRPQGTYATACESTSPS